MPHSLILQGFPSIKNCLNFNQNTYENSTEYLTKIFHTKLDIMCQEIILNKDEYQLLLFLHKALT